MYIYIYIYIEREISGRFADIRGQHSAGFAIAQEIWPFLKKYLALCFSKFFRAPLNFETNLHGNIIVFENFERSYEQKYDQRQKSFFSKLVSKLSGAQKNLLKHSARYFFKKWPYFLRYGKTRAMLPPTVGKSYIYFSIYRNIRSFYRHKGIAQRGFCHSARNMAIF